MLNNEINRFGSATFAEEHEIARAGLFKQRPNSLFLGFYGRRPIWYSGLGGLLMTAGARGGKLRDILAYNLCSGVCLSSLIALDMKGELAAISQDQTPDRKYCIYWNPLGLHGLPQHRLNPVDYIRKDSLTLVSDVKTFWENLIPASGSANGEYFERRAREFGEAIVLTIVQRNGILTLPDLYRVINLIPGNTEAWLDFAFDMSDCGFEISSRIEEEIANSREDSGNGFQGILGEIFKSVACLSDPVLLKSVSPPFDFSMADLCKSDQAYQVYLMPLPEFIEAWGPVIKSIFVAGMIYKGRAPHAPQQTWILDECAQLGGFPLITKMFSIGAGQGIRPWAVFQSTYQMKALGPDADNIITASAAVRQYFAVRDYASGQTVSNMLGTQTLSYDHSQEQARARLAKQKALHSLINGDDLFNASLQYAHHKAAAQMQTKQQRHLRTADEVLNCPPDKQFLFIDGLQNPIYADRRPYYEQRFMAGRYHPNPYHPPRGRVRVKRWLGHGWKRVVRETVPERFAQYPQYADGTWSRV